MNKIALIFLCILLNACTWNGIHISVLPDGNYSIIYESIGIKSDLENEDFVHPSNDNDQWVTTIEDNGDNSLTKTTINKEPIEGKLIFENEKNLSYWIDVQKKEYFLRNEHYFSAKIYDLRIDEKYPSIVDFLDVEADSISWLLPAKKYIIDSALLEYQKSFDNKIFFEKINNQLESYFDYVKKDSLIEKININSSLIVKDALKPMVNNLPRNFFKDIGPVINFHEKEFEKNTELMNDSFSFQLLLPGKIKKHNMIEDPVFSEEDDFNLYWEIEFQDISQDNFEMYGKSVIIKKNRVFWLMLMLFCCSYLIIRKVVV